MMKKVISTGKAPSAIGPYSQAIQVGNLVYTSGQIPIDPATGAFVEGGIKEQTRRSLLNVKAVLEEAGLTMGDVVKTTVFMADMNDFADISFSAKIAKCLLFFCKFALSKTNYLLVCEKGFFYFFYL